MKTREAIDHYGSVKALADALGIWPHNVSRWGERPPAARQYEIEVKTGGALKAEEASSNG
jgi:DNA-binding transcriptional regulator YdaS (Cro superfamily)